MAQPRRRPQRPPWYAGFVQSRLERFTTPLVREEERLIGKARRRLQQLAESEQRDTGRAAELAERQRAIEADPQFRQRVVATYDEVRAMVRQMKAAAGVSTHLLELEPLWDATPDMLMHLRHYGACAGGAKAPDYVDVPDLVVREFRQNLRRLREEAGGKLRVREASLLGQFGLLRGDGVYTSDTLVYYEILAALKLGAVLGHFEAPACRPVVWEMGGGWGGFAYQFKTLFPNVTYIISSHPDLFLLSASYLRILFPRARVRFYGEPAGADLWRDLSNVDFVFVPDNVVQTVRPDSVTLALDLMALERMTPDVAETHVRSAFDLRTTYFYSVMPISTAQGSLDVRTTLARYFWLLPVPQFDKRDALQPWSPSPRHDGVRRAHVIGWRRLLP